MKRHPSVVGPRLIVAGAYLEPRIYLLLREVLLALFEADLADLATLLEHQLTRPPSPLLTRQRDGHLTLWRLTDWGELVLCELRDVAQRPHLTGHERRLAIARTLAMVQGEGRPS